MSNMHRIIWFDQQIRRMKYPNCSTLAEHFEISVRQANRDLEYLRNTLSAPLEYVARRRGFVYGDQTFILPHMVITAEEKKVLGFLAHKYGNYDGTPINHKVSNLFQHLSGQLKEEPRIPFFSLKENDLTLFHTIRDSIANRHKMRIQYRDPDRGTLPLVIHPYESYGKGNTDYLMAYCEEYGDIYHFRLDRMAETAQTRERFHVPDYVKQAPQGGRPAKTPFKALLELEPDVDNSSFRGRKLTPAGEVLFQVEFTDPEELVADLMASTSWKNIVSPHWLRDKVKARCEELLAKMGHEAEV